MKGRECFAAATVILVPGMFLMLAPAPALSGEFLINTYRADRQRYPAAASDGGHYLVGWNSEGQDGSGSGVYGQFLGLDGSRFGPEFRLNSRTDMRQDSLHLSSNGSNFLAVWDSQEWGENQAYTTRVRGQLVGGDGLKTGPELTISQKVTVRDNWNYGVAANGSDYLTTWRINDHSTQYARIIAGNGEFRGPEFDTGIPGHSARPASNGTNYFLTWSDCESTWEIKGRLMSPAGVLYGPALPVNTYRAGQEEHSRIASDGVDYLVTWSGTQEGNYGVYGQVVSGVDGSALGPELHINSYTAGGQYPGGLASNGEDYLVTWFSEGQDGDGYGVYARLINADGAFIGSEFQVNSYTQGDQGYAAVASDGSGYLIVWSGEGMEENAGIYGNFLTAGDHTVFGYLTEAAASAALGEEWDLADLNELYGLHETAGGRLVIDGESWYYLGADFSQGGSWGAPRNIGDSWVNDGAKYVCLAAGSGVTTDAEASHAPLPPSLLLFASGLLGIGTLRKRRWGIS